MILTSLKTDGSIVCPSSRNNVVGIKPTVGLTARDGVIPTSRRQDTVGPFARTVKDAAIMLSAMAGPSKFDQATEKIPFKSIPNYAAACRGADLKRFRIGVPQDALEGLAGDILVVFEKATSVFKSRGAEVMTNVNLNCLAEFKAIDTENVLLRDFSTALSGYLTRLPTNPQKVYSFNDVIEFTKQDPREDCPGYGIEKFRKAFQSPQEDSDEYQNNLRRAINLATSYGALGALKRWKLDAIILPSSASSATSLAAIVGMPIVAIPMGYYPDETALQTSKKGDTFRAGPKFP
jgi:amidase